MANTERPRRRGRRLLGGLVVLFVLAILLVLLAPTLVSLGVANGPIRKAIDSRVEGTASFKKLNVGWLGPQSIDDLQVVDAGGRRVVDVDVEVSAGLLDLVAGMSSLTARLSGALVGDIDEDGSISLARLVKTDDTPDPAPGDTPVSLPAFGRVDLRLEDVSLDLHDTRSGRDLRLEDVKGGLDYTPGGVVKLRLEGLTRSESLVGSVDVSVRASGLVDRAGRLTPQKSSLEATLTVLSVPVLFSEIRSDLDSLVLSVRADDLAAAIEVKVIADATLEDSDTSHLEGELRLDRPLKDDGTFDLALDRLNGRLEGKRVPTGLLQPTLTAAGIVVDRDIGTTVDLSIAFDPGVARDFQVAVTSSRIDVDLRGRIDTEGGLVDLNEGSHVAAAISPELLSKHASVLVDRAAEVRVDLRRARLPLDFGEAGRLGEIALDGTVSLGAPIVVASREPDSPVANVAAFKLDLFTDRLADALRLGGAATVNDATITIDETIDRLFDASGELRVAQARPVGRLAITGLATSLLASFAPEHEAILKTLAGPAIDLTMITEAAGDDLRARVAARFARSSGEPGGPADIEVTAIEKADRVLVESATVRTDRLAALAAELQSGSEKPIVIETAAPLRIAVAPLTIMGARGGAYTIPPETMLSAHVAIETLGVLGLGEGLGRLTLRGLDATVGSGLETGPKLTLAGGGTLEPGGAAGRGGVMTLDLTWPRDGAADLPTGTVALRGAEVASWQAWLGSETPLTEWIGDRGDLALTLAPADTGVNAALNADLPRLQGVIDANIAEDFITVSAREVIVTPTLATLQALLPEPITVEVRPQPGQKPVKQQVLPLRLTKAVPLTLSIRSLRLPRNAPAGQPAGEGETETSAIDLSRAAIDLAVAVGTLAFEYPGGTSSTHPDVRLGIASTALADGATFTLKDKDGATIDVSGRLDDLLDEKAALALAGAALQLDASIMGLPTALIDSVAGWDGLLVAALGDRIERATFKADRFSAIGGSLDTFVKVPNGMLKGTVLGFEQGLKEQPDSRVEAELKLTSALGKRLLADVHPIFADLRSTQEPIRASLANLFLPLDGDVSRLNADIDMTVGEVQLDSGSGMLLLLSVFQKAEKPTVPAYIEPIRARIRKGVVSYERFAIRIDNKHVMNWEGTIDLNTGQRNLRTQYPLEGLALSFKELRGNVEGFVVPLVERGNGLQPDPDFDLAGSIAESQLKRRLNEVLKDEGVPLGDILGDIFGGKKKKKEGDGGEDKK